MYWELLNSLLGGGGLRWLMWRENNNNLLITEEALLIRGFYDKYTRNIVELSIMKIAWKGQYNFWHINVLKLSLVLHDKTVESKIDRN
jgi:hypothetical protein